MKFWDSSSIVPLLVQEECTARALELLQTDGVIIAWWATAVEWVSALARREREGGLSAAALGRAIERLNELHECWAEVEPGGPDREVACRLLRAQPPRAAEALPLGAH